MSCIIFGSAPCDDWGFLPDYLPETYGVICADGGLYNATHAKLRPHAVIGDWDSGGTPVVGIPAYSLPKEKDMTDLQAAIDLGLSQGYRTFLLCGCTGGRLDHTAFNLMLLEWIHNRGGHGILLDGENEVRFVSNGAVTLPNDPKYRYLSILPLDSQVHGVTLTGVKYPLEDITLTRGETLSVSNEPDGTSATISVQTGCALVIRSERQR